MLAVGSTIKTESFPTFPKETARRISLLGEDIWLASRNGKTYGTKGTSFAAAYASAAAAVLLFEYPDLLPQEIRECLIRSADKIEDEGATTDNAGILRFGVRFRICKRDEIV